MEEEHLRSRFGSWRTIQGIDFVTVIARGSDRYISLYTIVASCFSFFAYPRVSLGLYYASQSRDAKGAAVAGIHASGKGAILETS